MLIHRESKSIILKAKDPTIIKNILPAHRTIDYKGHNLAVRHGLDEVRILRNIGINAPPPILYYYDWPGKYTPFKHQKETAAFLTIHPRCFCLNEMGTAKTASALWAADYLMNVKAIKKVLVVAPLSTLERVWQDEIFNVLMHRRCVILHGSRERRLELLNTDADFYIINPHGVVAIATELKGRHDINLVIVDEAATYRNARTKMYKILESILPGRRVWLCTGTPCPNAPTDAWALSRLIDKVKAPSYFSQWQRETMLQVTQFKWVPRADSYEKAYRIMQPAIRYKKADCLDLPPMIVERRSAPLTDAQKRAYKTMQARMVMEADGEYISAVNAADRISKLRQILCGVIKNTATEEYEELDHQPRVDVTIEAIEQASAKVIVIVPFKGIIKALEREIGKQYSVEVLNGDVPPKQRAEIIKRFSDEKDPHVLLCHPKVMAHGLNLVAADTIVFYGPIYSNDEAQQVENRISRPGQTRKMTIVQIAASTLEWEIYRLVAERRLTQDNILSLYKQEILGYIKP